MRILIGALSGWKCHDRRQCCLSTWMHDADELKIDAVFLLGCATAARPEQIGPHALALLCPDDYPSLSQRTRWFCRWAIEEGGGGKAEGGWDYLFKCDDDTYVSIPRLAAYAAKELAGRDYVGAQWRAGVGYASGGAGYFLSRKAAELVARRLTTPQGAEDLLVGQVLQGAGMRFSIEPRLVPFGSVHCRPTRDNDLITLHGVGAEVFLASHAETGWQAATSSAPAALG